MCVCALAVIHHLCLCVCVEKKVMCVRRACVLFFQHLCDICWVLIVITLLPCVCVCVAFVCLLLRWLAASQGDVGWNGASYEVI